MIPQTSRYFHDVILSDHEWSDDNDDDKFTDDDDDDDNEFIINDLTSETTNPFYQVKTKTEKKKFFI